MATESPTRKAKKRAKQLARAKTLWKQLMGSYPVFRQYKTLEVGVKAKLIDEINNSVLFAETSTYIVEIFLRRYTHHDKYLKNALKFKTRYSLKDEDVGVISEQDLAYFTKELKVANKRKSKLIRNKKDKIAKEAHDKFAAEQKRREAIRKKRPTLYLKKPSL